MFTMTEREKNGKTKHAFLEVLPVCEMILLLAEHETDGGAKETPRFEFPPPPKQTPV